MSALSVKRPRQFDISKWLKKHAIPYVNTVFAGGITALHVAAFHCDFEAMASLTSFGDVFSILTINYQSVTGITPIMAVCSNPATTMHQKESTIKASVRKLGASTCLTDQNGQNIAGHALRAQLSTKFFGWLFDVCQVPTDSTVCVDKYPLIVYASIMNARQHFIAIHDRGDTPKSRLRNCLFVAIASGSDDIIKLILSKYPALINTVTIPGLDDKAPNKATLLHLACGYGRCSSVAYLINCCPSMLGTLDGDGFTPFMYAVYNKNLDVVKRLICHNPRIVLDTNPFTGDTGLHLACQQGNLEIANTLLDKGALPFVQNFADETPLHCLVSRIYTASDWSGQTVLEFRRLMTRLVDFCAETPGSTCFVVNGQGNTPFLAAAQARNHIAMEFFVRDLPTKIFVRHTRTAVLPYTTLAGHGSMSLEAVENTDVLRCRMYHFRYRRRSSSFSGFMTLSPPAYRTNRSINVAQLSNDTVGDSWAADSEDAVSVDDEYSQRNQESHERVAWCLPITGETLVAYVNRFAQTITSQTNAHHCECAVNLAISNHNHHKYLLSPVLLKFMYVTLGCRMHLQDAEGNTPFMVACRQGNLPCVLWLKYYAGVDTPITFTNHSGVTAFMFACASGNMELFVWMVSQFFADPHTLHQLLERQDSNGLTALIATCLAGRIDILRALTTYTHGIDEWSNCQSRSDKRSAKGTYMKALLIRQVCRIDHKNALLYAAREGHIEVVKWIVSQIGVKSSLGSVDKYQHGLLYFAQRSGNKLLVDFCESLLMGTHLVEVDDFNTP